MLIINPIYDVSFKYLLEDAEIARELLSLLLGEEIESLTVFSQETTAESEDGKSIKIFRLDFRAIVKIVSDEYKKVLIEIQKAKREKDVLRFRRYLGLNYRVTDEVNQQDGTKQTEVLRIAPIYFLGFKLPEIPLLAFKSKQSYFDLVTQQPYEPKQNCRFVDLLTHESIFIQIPRLENMTAQTRIQKVLKIFDQRYLTQANRHYLDYQGDRNDPLLDKMLNRLSLAYLESKVIRQLEAEEELELEEEANNKLIEDLKQAKENAEKAREEAEREREQERQAREKLEKAQMTLAVERWKAEAEKEQERQNREKAEAEKAKAEEILAAEKKRNEALLQKLAELEAMMKNK